MESLEEDGDPAGRQYDAEELAAFLASAPEGLKDWAGEQLARMQAVGDDDEDAVGIDAFAEDYEQDDSSAPHRREPRRAGGFGKVNLVLVALLAAALVIIVQQLGRPASQPQAAESPAPSAAPSAQSTYAKLDEKKVAELKKRLQANPKDTAVLQQLAELYLGSGMFQDAIEHLTTLLQVDPGNVDALLAIGVAEFNTGKDDAAERHWLQATKAAPTKAQPWYNLGFLYMARTPPDHDKVKQAWSKVIELDPKSELAKTAEAHLKRLNPSPSPSPER